MNCRDKSGCTPLLIAAQYAQSDLVAYLICCGADAAAVDMNGDTALHWASYKGSVEVVGLLQHLSSNNSRYESGSSRIVNRSSCNNNSSSGDVEVGLEGGGTIGARFSKHSQLCLLLTLLLFACCWNRCEWQRCVWTNPFAFGCFERKCNCC